MCGLVVGAAVLGIIIMTMEKGEFPGWGKMILCVLAAAIPELILSKALEPSLVTALVAVLVGAVCSGFAISATCGMSLKRASIAAGIYLVIKLALVFGFMFILKPSE